MKCVGIVLHSGDSISKLQAKRYYAELNTKVYYFKCDSQYWVNFLRRNVTDGMAVVALSLQASAALTAQAVPHTLFSGQSIKTYLLSNFN